jgi:hypothetical protein
VAAQASAVFSSFLTNRDLTSGDWKERSGGKTGKEGKQGSAPAARIML